MDELTSLEKQAAFATPIIMITFWGSALWVIVVAIQANGIWGGLGGFLVAGFMFAMWGGPPAFIVAACLLCFHYHVVGLWLPIVSIIWGAYTFFITLAMEKVRKGPNYRF